MASNVGLPATTVLTGASALNTAGVLDGGVAHAYHTLTVVAGTGSTAGVVSLELSQDGSNWFAPASNTITVSAAGNTSVTVGPIPAQFARARISTAITGGTVTAQLASA